MFAPPTLISTLLHFLASLVIPDLYITSLSDIVFYNKRCSVKLETSVSMRI